LAGGATARDAARAGRRALVLRGRFGDRFSRRFVERVANRLVDRLVDGRLVTDFLVFDFDCFFAIEPP
jgi:hypothetical protein